MSLGSTMPSSEFHGHLVPGIRPKDDRSRRAECASFLGPKISAKLPQSHSASLGSHWACLESQIMWKLQSHSIWKLTLAAVPLAIASVAWPEKAGLPYL
jgi:hypothetical protein